LPAVDHVRDSLTVTVWLVLATSRCVQIVFSKHRYIPRMKITVAAMLLAASLAAPATAHADDVPSVDQVVAIMAELTDPDKPAASKTDIVTPGFSPDEAGTIDDHLNQERVHLPLNFVVTDIQPAPNNSAGATLATDGVPRRHTHGHPIVLVDQDGHWMIAHDSAVAELEFFWRASRRTIN
jgi:hypothetical protein